jgi:hypothetical protein
MAKVSKKPANSDRIIESSFELLKSSLVGKANIDATEYKK